MTFEQICLFLTITYYVNVLVRITIIATHHNIEHFSTFLKTFDHVDRDYIYHRIRFLSSFSFVCRRLPLSMMLAFIESFQNTRSGSGCMWQIWRFGNTIIIRRLAPNPFKCKYDLLISSQHQVYSAARL